MRRPGKRQPPEPAEPVLQAWCPAHGPKNLPAHEYVLHLVDPAPFFEWWCDECRDVITQPAGTQAIDLLTRHGAVVVDDDAGPVVGEPVLLHVFDMAPPLTLDDVIDFGLALERLDDVVAAVK